MKTRKLLAIVLTIVMVAAMLVACAPKEEITWTVTVEGADKKEFTSTDYAKLSKVSVDTVLKTKDGTTKEQTWEGVLLKDVIDYIGTGDYTSVTMEASDGYAQDYTVELIDDSMTVLGTKVNGEVLGEEDGYVQSVAGSQPGNMWIKMLTKITVNR